MTCTLNIPQYNVHAVIQVIPSIIISIVRTPEHSEIPPALSFLMTF